MKRHILACITPQLHCKNIISAAQLMAQGLGATLCVVTVLPIKEKAKARAEKLKTLKSISDECKVDIMIRYSDNPEVSIAAQAKQIKPLHVFMGEDNGFLTKFLSHYNQAPVSIVSKQVIFTVPQIKGA